MAHAQIMQAPEWGQSSRGRAASVTKKKRKDSIKVAGQEEDRNRRIKKRRAQGTTHGHMAQEPLGVDDRVIGKHEAQKQTKSEPAKHTRSEQNYERKRAKKLPTTTQSMEH